jgi:hypothetical protein
LRAISRFFSSCAAAARIWHDLCVLQADRPRRASGLDLEPLL